MTEQGEWIECVVDNNYEIWNQEPFPIRRKGTDRIIRECIRNDGYAKCCLNRKAYLKHRIIALQFIPNPDDLPEIDHVNTIKTDNRIENLRWVSHSENNKNRTSNKGRQYAYIDELPETAKPLDAYNGWEFDGLFVDYKNEKLYLFNGARYRELVATRTKGYIYYNLYDIENNFRHINHKLLFD